MRSPSRFKAPASAVRRPLRRGLLVLALLALPLAAVQAQITIETGVPGLSIGINFGQPPQFTRVPDYPVYYAPQVRNNLFFYDGRYWAYVDDDWYTGDWYNGPWTRVRREYVPLYVLRVPVRYYRAPPPHFRGWGPDKPPHWDEHWGPAWARAHPDWDRWDRRQAPQPAPLPSYQKKYSGDRYPSPERQQEIRRENYRYEPRDPVVREHYPAPPGKNKADKNDKNGKGHGKGQGGKD